MRANAGWLFYRDIYSQGDNESHIKETMEKILNIKATDESLNIPYRFKMKTTYPGLLIGSGYIHGISSDNDAKIGFYFDHTTGLPVIPGSSIKGMLRSAFGLSNTKKDDPYKEQKHNMIRELLQKDKSLDIQKLAKEIFEGVDSETGKPKSIYQRDRFYEARVVEIEDKLFDDDYLSPHYPNLLQNPKPIKFIKVAPGVTFEFAFHLIDSPQISAGEKMILFARLLQFYGIGAKTNVGYGQFEEWDDRQWEQFKKKEELQNLTGFERFIKELEQLKKADNNMVKKIKEYQGEIEDIDRVKEIVNSKKSNEKFYKRIMKYLDGLE